MPRAALVVIDMLNPYEHQDAERLCLSVERVVEPLRRLVARVRERDVPLIYVNDNHSDWTASRHDISARALAGARPDLVEPVVPPDDCAFVLKARHSIFYSTPLDYLLRQQDIRRVVLAGQVTEQCILYSALDAYVRHFDVSVPRDAVAHIEPDLADAALRMMQENMRAEIIDAADAFG
jgi:nicotinamidase-related amidase